MSTVSTHVLDTALGRPAAGVRVTLERLDDGGVTPTLLGAGTTDADGRLRELGAPGSALAAGLYQLRFAVGEYLARTGREPFYPEVVVRFRLTPADAHYHLPLLLSPFGYSTYRGS